MSGKIRELLADVCEGFDKIRSLTAGLGQNPAHAEITKALRAREGILGDINRQTGFLDAFSPGWRTSADPAIAGLLSNLRDLILSTVKYDTDLSQLIRRRMHEAEEKLMLLPFSSRAAVSYATQSRLPLTRRG